MFTSQSSILGFFIDYSYYYPLFMAYLWMTGATFFYWRFERPKRGAPDGPPVLEIYPFVAIVVPCHDEGPHINETVSNLLQCNYPNYEIVLVNDGSADETRMVLENLAAQHSKVRVIHLAQNQGKAVALTTAALMTSAEYLACIDADALLDPDAVTWLMSQMIFRRIFFHRRSDQAGPAYLWPGIHCFRCGGLLSKIRAA
jgi:biofilm PGA synthesis N-glycosyltransferase PgaC